MAVATTEVAAGGGRTLTVYESGDPAGAPILFHHGTPASGLPYEPHVRLVEEQGIRLVSYDRAGYGGSTRDRGRDVAAVAHDVATITAALGIDRFATWGWSGGGPHALACAALLPDRVAGACSLAGVAPYDAEGLDWLEGMGEGNVAKFGAALEGEATLRPALEAEALAGRTSSAELVAALRTILSAPDVAALEEGIGAPISSPASSAGWRAASTAGSTTISPSRGRGASRRRRSGRRCSSSRAGRI